MAKQLIVCFFGVITTLLTYDLVKTWKGQSADFVCISVGVIAVALFLDKLEYLELLHPDGKGYNLMFLMLDILDVSLYAIGLAVLFPKEKGETQAPPITAAFASFSGLFFFFIFRVALARRKFCALNIYSTIGTVQCLLVALADARGWFGPKVLVASLVPTLILYGIGVTRSTREGLLGMKAGA